MLAEFELLLIFLYHLFFLVTPFWFTFVCCGGTGKLLVFLVYPLFLRTEFNKVFQNPFLFGGFHRGSH